MDHSLPQGDGYSIRAKYLLEAQAAAGHEVTVLTSPSQGAAAPDFESGGVTYRRSFYSAWQQKLVDRGAKHIIFGRAIGAGLARLLDAGSFELVHAHTPFTVARAALQAARRRKLPFIYEKRNLWEESAQARGKMSGRWPFYELARAMDLSVTRHADAVCTITEALKTNTISRGVAAERVFVVGNGVDTNAFTPRPAPPELRKQCARGAGLVIGFVGSFFSFEGLPLLVEAFSRLLPKFPEARLVLVGDGEDRPKLDRLVKELGLGESVWLVGRVPHDKVVDFYAAMDVLVYPRYHSKLTDMISPLKPLEPMAMARCIVASDVGGLRELIRDGDTGLLFAADSAASLQDRLDRLLSKQVDAAALGRNAREHVIAHRQWQHMARHYEDAYEHARQHPNRS